MHYGQVLEDPDYYNEEDDMWAEELVEEYEHAQALEDFDPFNTVNS